MRREKKLVPLDIQWSGKITGFVLVAILLVALGPLLNGVFVFPTLDKILMNESRDESMRVAQHLKSDFAKALTTEGGLGEDSPEIAKLLQATENFDIEKIKIFNAIGLTVYSTAPADIGVQNTRSYFRQHVMRGESYVKMVLAGQPSMSGQLYSADLVETYVPIMDGNRFVGAFEIYYDITERRADHHALFFRGWGIGTAAALVLMAVAFIMLRAARKNATRLMETETKQHDILNAVGVGIVVVDNETRSVVYVNHTALDWMGMGAEEIIGEKCEIFSCEADSGNCPVLDQGQTIHEVECKLKCAAGKVLPILRTVLPVTLNGRDCLVESMQDIDEYKLLQEKMVRNERLTAVGTLAAGVAHEFNNLHAGILGYLDLLQASEQLSDMDRRSVKLITGAAERAASLTRDLLVFARGQETSKQTMELDVAIGTVMKILQAQVQKEKIDIKVDLQPTQKVFISSARIEQVVTNLVINASHALIDCPVRQISVSTGVEGERAWLRVSDTGCGICEEDLTSIYTPFFTTKGENARPGSPLAAVKGTGLGLCVCDMIVRDHGGEIEVKSEVDAGTTFTVWLPVMK